MSLTFKKKTKLQKFDTVELIPSADNYGKPSKSSQKRALPTFSEAPEDDAFSADAATAADGDYSMHSTAMASPSGAPPTTPSGGGDVAVDLDDLGDEEHEHRAEPAKFGTFDGVLGRCLLCMWGVIMFLRTGWIVGNAGVWQATLVMVLSASITMFTTLSLSAICTNGEISHGGPYFLISRSLGPNLGGVIGLLFAIGNAVGVGLHLVGFSEAIVSLYQDNYVTSSRHWDTVLWAQIGLGALMCIALRGVGSIIKFNLFLLFLMFVSIIAFFLGAVLPNSVLDRSGVGFTNFSATTFANNWDAQYLPGNNFLTMVAIFFPSVTGCMAGANISGDLRNPAVNIPVGTIAAVVFSMAVYVIIAWILGATVERGPLDDNGECGANDTVGLLCNYVIMSDVSVWRPLVDIGIYASTFSSATSCFVAAPRIFKAVCDDGLFPAFNVFAVGRASDGEPVRCYILVLVICFGIIMTGDINFIAPMVTNFFLITYALVNYSVFAWDISKSPGWRPTFKYYSPYLSLFAALQSVLLMFLINWAMAAVTAVVGFLIYKYIERRDVDTNWGTTVESTLYLKGCKIALKYQAMNTEHAKIARPTFLMMLYDEAAAQRDTVTLFGLAQLINFSQGLLMIGHVLRGDIEDAEVAAAYVRRRKSYREYVNGSEVVTEEMLKQCIMECCVAPTYEQGTRAILQLAGMGGMQPNVFMMKLDDLALQLAARPIAPIAQEHSEQNGHTEKAPLWFSNLRSALLSGLGIICTPKHFELEHILDPKSDGKSEGTIDIWWLFDDGGLTILTGYLLTKHKEFKNHRLRIMALDEIGFDADSTDMVHLLAKLRIDAEIIHVSTEEAADMATPMAEERKTEVDGDAEGDADGDGDRPDGMGSRKMSLFAQGKIAKYRRVGNTISNYSADAKMCLLTMPYPRDKFEWWEYAQVIHDLTPQDIPTVFVRGTQDQVLTFCF